MVEYKCRKCGDLKEETKFVFVYLKNGSKRRAYICNRCVNNRNKDKKSAAQKQKRKKFPAAAILVDSRNRDNKKSLENNLTLEFVEQQIAKPCIYCGETTLRMTLDRKNNDKGHTQDNCVPACIRCNYIRRSMPYTAWLVISHAVRKARIQGLFGDWTARCR